MIVYKKLKIKNCPTFIFDNMMNIKKIDPSVVCVNKISLTNYEIEYYGNLIYDSPLHIVFNDVDAYFYLLMKRNNEFLLQQIKIKIS